MKVSTEQGADRQAIVQVEIEPSELEQAMDRAYRRVVRQYNINGFRPGKAPRSILERRLGRGVLLEEAARELVPKLTSDVIEEQQLDAIAQPDVEITNLEPLTFTATIPLRPVVTLGDYRSVRVASQEIEITEAQVDEVIERLRTGRATFSEPTEARPAAEGDRVTIDLASSIEGEPLEEPRQDVTADLGAASGGRQPDLLPELQAAIVGLNIGEQAETTVSFDEDYREERVAGKTVRFDITLKGIQERHLPELDAEFIAQVSDATTVEELRERVRTNLETTERDRARQEVSRAVVDLVTEGSTIEMPPVLVENQVAAQLEERQSLFARQGIQWERVLEITNQTEEQVRAELRPEAERRVRNSLVLVEVARAEDLTVTPEAVNAEIEARVATYPPEQQVRLRERLFGEEGRAAIENGLFETMIIDHLIELATEGRGYAVGPGEGGVAALASLVATAEDEESEAAEADSADEPATDAPTDDEPAGDEEPATDEPADDDEPSATPAEPEGAPTTPADDKAR